MLLSSNICSFLLMDDILNITPKRKSPIVLSKVILDAILGNCLFQSTSSESVHLKANQLFPKSGGERGTPSCWNRASQDNYGTV
jgi:hypothetical protein